MVRRLMTYGVMMVLLTTTTFAFAESVYVTANGSKYHKASCRLMRNNEKAKEIPKEDALKNKYEPCKQCFKEDLPEDVKKKINKTSQEPAKGK